MLFPDLLRELKQSRPIKWGDFEGSAHIPNHEFSNRVRKIKLHIVTNEVTDLRCSECGWTYSIPHVSDIADRIEEDQAARSYTTHLCSDFPVDGVNSKAS